MRTFTTQNRIEEMVDTALDRVPDGPSRELTREVTQGMTRQLVKLAGEAPDMDDIALAKLLVRAGYTLGALHFANIDMLIRQDMAKEAGLVG